MKSQKRIFLLRFINAILFLVAISLQYNNIFSLKILTANPMLSLSLLVGIAMFSSEFTATITGLVVGIFIDGVSSTVPGFHAICFLLLALGAALTVRHLFNNNVFSAVALCLIGSSIYYILRWALCIASHLSLNENLTYLMQTAFGSVLYTCAFVIPIYFLEKFLYSKFYR